MKIYLAGCLNVGGFDLNLTKKNNPNLKILDSYFYVEKFIEKLTGEKKNEN